MKILLELEVDSTDGTSLLREDVEATLRDALSRLPMVWHDASLGRQVEARIGVTSIQSDKVK